MLAIDYEVAIQPTAQMMTDWLCRQDEPGKIELEDTQTAVEMLRGMMDGTRQSRRSASQQPSPTRLMTPLGQKRRFDRRSISSGLPPMNGRLSPDRVRLGVK
jgi:hypothetical protein